jgi:hypothetical protein
MKRTTFATSFGLACWITVLGAQRAPAPTEQPAHNVFVLTGCLEQGNAPAAFRLTRASVIGQAPPRSSTSAATGTKAEDVYELQPAVSVSEEGLSREKLQTDVGARVEVTIRPVETVAPAPPLATHKESAEKPTESPRQRYTVIKLSRLANSCA